MSFKVNPIAYSDNNYYGYQPIRNEINALGCQPIKGKRSYLPEDKKGKRRPTFGSGMPPTHPSIGKKIDYYI